ncbi:MAG TPA: nucleotidyltransferase family protein [Eubacteriales bacterium]|nr:nucleotidyltransferase family protein [Eubacteriales bacterium]
MQHSQKINIGCVLMLAGKSRRFYGDKLTHDIDGKPMAEHVMLALKGSMIDECCAVTRSDQAELLSLIERFGFDTVINDDVEAGQSKTIRLGTEYLMRLERFDGIMYTVGDQPYLKTSPIDALIESFRSAPLRIHALACGQRRGNPVIFPASLYGELCGLSGDVGGTVVIRRHMNMLELCDAASEDELRDVDYRGGDNESDKG